MLPFHIYMKGKINKQTNKKSKYLAAFKQCVSHLSFKQDKRVSLWLFLGSGMIFQVSGQGMGSLLCRNSGFARDLGSGAVQVCGMLRDGWEGAQKCQKQGWGIAQPEPALLQPKSQLCSSQTAAVWASQSPRETSLPCLQEKHTQSVYETSYGDELTFKTLHSLHFHL